MNNTLLDWIFEHMGAIVALVFGLAVCFLIIDGILFLTNRELFCKLEMLGSIQNVPAFCLEKVLIHLK